AQNRRARRRRGRTARAALRLFRTGLPCFVARVFGARAERAVRAAVREARGKPVRPLARRGWRQGQSAGWSGARLRSREADRGALPQRAGSRHQIKQVHEGRPLMDLIIRNARLSTRPEDRPVDIGVENGRIAAIAPALAADGKEHDAAGGVVCAGLIETHIHLDKSRIIERCPPEETREVSPVKSVAPMKKTWTVEDVHARAARTLEECIKH